MAECNPDTVSAEDSTLSTVFDEMDMVDFGKVKKETGRNRVPTVWLTTDMVTKTTATLCASPLLTASVNTALINTPVDDLTKSLAWVDSCLVDRRLLLSVSRENVWQQYHRKLLLNLPSMTSVIKSRQAAALLALYIMKDLVHSNYAPPTSMGISIAVSEREQDILMYISGYLLKRFKETAEAKALMSDVATGFTAAINRGGLVKPLTEFVHVVKEMEVIFRELPLKSVDYVLFSTMLVDKDVPSHLFSLLESVTTDPESKEGFCEGIFKIFFAVRAHQKCRHLLEQYIHKHHISRQTKALRDSF